METVKTMELAPHGISGPLINCSWIWADGNDGNQNFGNQLPTP